MLPNDGVHDGCFKADLGPLRKGAASVEGVEGLICPPQSGQRLRPHGPRLPVGGHRRQLEHPPIVFPSRSTVAERLKSIRQVEVQDGVRWRQLDGGGKVGLRLCRLAE